MDDAARFQLSGMGRLITNLLCFAIAFCCTCALLGVLVGFPKVPEIPDKLRLLRTTFSDCDVVFFGSSRVVHQIDPKLFDQTVAAAGGQVKSFNFGVDSLWPPESLYVLREILRHPTPRLKWIFIELMPVEGTMREGQDKMLRTQYWHDRRHTNIAERAVLDRYPKWSLRLPLLWRHEVLWVKKATHQGEGAQRLHALLWPHDVEREEEPWAERAGFLPAPDEVVEGKTRQWFIRTLKTNGEDLAHQATGLPKSLHREYRPLMDELRERGVEPIFFISPGLSRKTNYRKAPNGAKLISFARPDLYPELLVPELFRDGSHLNARGTAMFTPLLAHKFLELTRPPP